MTQTGVKLAKAETAGQPCWHEWSDHLREALIPKLRFLWLLAACKSPPSLGYPYILTVDVMLSLYHFWQMVRLSKEPHSCFTLWLRIFTHHSIENAPLATKMFMSSVFPLHSIAAKSRKFPLWKLPLGLIWRVTIPLPLPALPLQVQFCINKEVLGHGYTRHMIFVAFIYLFVCCMHHVSCPGLYWWCSGNSEWLLWHCGIGLNEKF